MISLLLFNATFAAFYSLFPFSPVFINIYSDTLFRNLNKRMHSNSPKRKISRKKRFDRRITYNRLHLRRKMTKEEKRNRNWFCCWLPECNENWTKKCGKWRLSCRSHLKNVIQINHQRLNVLVSHWDLIYDGKNNNPEKTTHTHKHTRWKWRKKWWFFLCFLFVFMNFQYFNDDECLQ